MGFFWKKGNKSKSDESESKKEERAQQEWNLDFLTPYEKSSINVAFEFAEALIEKQSGTSKDDYVALKQAKKHYLADEGYTEKDIALISMWVGVTEKMMRENPIPGTEEILKTLQRVKEKFVKEKVIERLTGKPMPSSESKTAAVTLDFLTKVEKMTVEAALDATISAVKDAKLKENLRTAKKHVAADKDYTIGDIKMILLALGFFRKFLDNATFPSGSEGEAMRQLPEIAERAEKKITQKYVR